MIIQSTSIDGRHYWERNPQNQFLVHTGTYAPHLGAMRLGYTVPAGRRAKVQSISASMQTTAVPGTAGEAKCFVVHHDGAGTSWPYRLTMWNSALTSRASDSLADVDFLAEGETIEFRTQDDAIGGNVTYNLSLSVMEFDA